MKRWQIRLLWVGLMLVAGAAGAGECTSNSWRPTFVRHDLVAPTVYYAESGGGFTPMATPDEAQQTCLARGVRNSIDYQDCRQRNWGDFGCGCNIYPNQNGTCQLFQSFLRTQGYSIP